MYRARDLRVTPRWVLDRPKELQLIAYADTLEDAQAKFQRHLGDKVTPHELWGVRREDVQPEPEMYDGRIVTG